MDLIKGNGGAPEDAVSAGSNPEIAGSEPGSAPPVLPFRGGLMVLLRKDNESPHIQPIIQDGFAPPTATDMRTIAIVLLQQGQAMMNMEMAGQQREFVSKQKLSIANGVAGFRDLFRGRRP